MKFQIKFSAELTRSSDKDGSAPDKEGSESSVERSMGFEPNEMNTNHRSIPLEGEDRR